MDYLQKQLLCLAEKILEQLWGFTQEEKIGKNKKNIVFCLSINLLFYKERLINFYY
ncbi:hypothetical protein RhiirA5_365873 [Rhizophagus irregularis]|uniref:Uncharacterized protein n=1 Tax=Rhizophagus irregularis TaxID=588596 RepID=A0A2N0P083_9GLOM|nr:hypothetical protein RhiirA5_365873 [Rhizophagus irregularis]